MNTSSKSIAISPVVLVDKYNQSFFSFDYRWMPLCRRAGYTPLFISYDLEYILSHPPDILLFSGGNDLGSVPYRDDFEYQLFCQLTLSMNIPTIGICRGAQFLTKNFGGDLIPCTEHAGTEHKLTQRSINVRSFHNWSIANLPSTLIPTDFSPDGLIEEFVHQSLPIKGLMWHPEREANLELSTINDIFSFK